MSPGVERGDEDALNTGAEDVAVHGAVEDPGRIDPVVAQGRDEGGGGPLPERCRAQQPLALRRPSPERGHVRLHPGLIDEDQRHRVDPALMPLPPLAAAVHIGAFALIGDQRLFLKLTPQPRRNRQTVSWLTVTPRSARSYCRPLSVTCGQVRTCFKSQSRCGARIGRRYPPEGLAPYRNPLRPTWRPIAVVTLRRRHHHLPAAKISPDPWTSWPVS